MKTTDKSKNGNQAAVDRDITDTLPAEPEAQEFLHEKSDWSKDISQYRKDKKKKK